MQKLKMHSPDMTQANIAHIRIRFPHCVTEAHDVNGNIVYKVDFDLLRQELAGEIVEGPQERYRLDWPGKRQAMLAANAPIAKSLRPCRGESVDFDTTENLYIEGDNLEVLKLLQESYLGKVKMIYIDPPYNTGNDFIYNDDFAEDSREFLHRDGQYDDGGNRMQLNLESNGRFHSDWLSMIYQRLCVSRTLLANDGVLIVSISDSEINNIMKVCDEIFGQSNFCGDIVWNSTKSVTNTALISVSHTYNLVYFKNIEYFVEHREEFRLPDNGSGFNNPDNDPRGAWKADPFQVGGWRPNQQYVIVNPNTGIEYKPNPGCSWKNDFDKYQELIADNRIVFGRTGDGGPQRKRFIWEAQERGKVAKTLWDDVETTTNGTQLLKKLFDGVSLFDNPKPVSLIHRFLQLATRRDSIVMDFFSGSATTAHAVMQLNSEDDGKRKFIMVQWPEICPSGSEAVRAGYNNICEIGKERIRRAGKKIKEEQPLITQNLDIGFRVLKVQPSCMTDAYYVPDEAKQSLLLYDNIKIDATPEDLIFQVLIDWGVELHLPIAIKSIKGKEVFFIDENSLVACFERDIDDDFIKEVAGYKPIRVVFRDSGFANDAARINAEQIFKQLSPDTEVRVL